MTFESNQKRSEHVHGTGGLLSSLNQRLFFIRRLKNSIGHTDLLKISHGLFISKLRYGLQLLGCVRWKDLDPTNKDLEALQKSQNKLLRALNVLESVIKLVMNLYWPNLKFFQPIKRMLRSNLMKCGSLLTLLTIQSKQNFQNAKQMS